MEPAQEKSSRATAARRWGPIAAIIIAAVVVVVILVATPSNDEKNNEASPATTTVAEETSSPTTTMADSDSESETGSESESESVASVVSAGAAESVPLGRSSPPSKSRGVASPVKGFSFSLESESVFLYPRLGESRACYFLVFNSQPIPRPGQKKTYRV